MNCVVTTFEPTTNLLCDPTDKTKYMAHYTNLKFYPNQEMKKTRIWLVYKFKQSPWLAEYVNHNTQLRTKAKTNIEKKLNN